MPVTKKEDRVKAANSAWNVAGTWEDKKLKKEILAKIIKDELIHQDNIQKEAFSGIKLIEIKSISGEGSLVMVRGKKRLGYELNLELIVASYDLSNEGVISI